MAKTQAQNERLTRVGAGTPMGELLRRYWHPVAAAAEFDANPVRKIRILGEDLTLYRSTAGAYGLVGPTCPHRCVSLALGIPDERGLRCCYHGWLFDASGACLEQPYDDRVNAAARFRDKVRITAYPVQELGGLVFAYLGPAPVPLLPRWDLLVRDDLQRTIDVHPIPCNWLQCMDNSVDPIHFEFLHAGFGNYQLERLGRPPGMRQARHVKIAFDVFEYGIVKRRLLEGETEEADEWRIGHPLLFPATLALGNEGSAGFQFRAPVDDTHTRHYLYSTSTRPPDAPPKPIAYSFENMFDADGNIVVSLDRIIKQDIAAWVAQGPISDRTQEHLSVGDTGVILYHKLLEENMDRVARGEEPLGVVRDPAVNEPMIVIRRGRERLGAFHVRDDLRPAIWSAAAAS